MISSSMFSLSLWGTWQSALKINVNSANWYDENYIEAFAPRRELSDGDTL